MMNREKYCFDDFTYDKYREFINSAKMKYSFVQYDSFDKSIPSIILRHDVDFSIKSALEMAEIEAEENIHSTFFFNLRCSFYNMLEEKELNRIKAILKLGHAAGIHFDISAYTITDINELEEKIGKEKMIFEDFLDTQIKLISFHNPTLSDNEFYTKQAYAEMINVYSDEWKDFKYISDSNGYWRHDRLFDVINERKNSLLHVLIHPGNWNKQVLSPFDRIKSCVTGRTEEQLKDFKELLEANGRKIIDG